MKHILLYLFLVATAFAQDATRLANAPYSPSRITDIKGNEWFLDSNGNLEKNGIESGLIGTCMVLSLENQQVYFRKAVVTSGSGEIILTTEEPVQRGIRVSRNVTFLNKEGSVCFVDTLSNTTNLDLKTTVTYQQTLNSAEYRLFTNTGRKFNVGITADETGLIAFPPIKNRNNVKRSLAFTIRAANAPVVPKVTVNPYRIAYSYPVTIPAGQSISLITGVSQIGKVSSTPEEIASVFKTLPMYRFTRNLPKPTLKSVINASDDNTGYNSRDWHPSSFWDIAPEDADILLLDGVSKVKGTVVGNAIPVSGSMGQVELKFDEIAALAGPGYVQSEKSWIWLRDGQRWNGKIALPSLKFNLTNGAELAPTQIPRIIFAKKDTAHSGSRDDQFSLIETWQGDRIAFKASGNFEALCPWGPLSVPWTEIILLSQPTEAVLGHTLALRNGSRLRVLLPAKNFPVQTRHFGEQSIQATQIRQIATPLSEQTNDDELTTSYMDLVGEQRLVGRITNPSFSLLTQNGAVTLVPIQIHRMISGSESDISEEVSNSETPIFKAELWGGGVVVGQLAESFLSIEGNGYAWDIPARQIVEFVNPVQMVDNNMLGRITTLIQQLGDTQWKVREKATRDLKDIGSAAKPNLQKARKLSKDEEVNMRLDYLLSQFE